ncbi:shikimate dehydrogenase [Microvirga sp. VF16]|uniref:shikimate dehydrogenase family protein n=1 Tax=Microvirga sp. VF16 TaxID=2807101 RepID=UPI00193D1116|nr:shikimate dehydrogenase [Microvirga sp. VF16]QRM33175.1 shikimate dehydrogenase [Microvirga sp. VF16]
MAPAIDGATRLNVIIGDPIAQVKSPAGMTAAFARDGRNAVMLPVRIASANLELFLKASDRVSNLDGIVVTVPHKFACFKHCKTISERAEILRAVNIMRRNKDGSWHGDMVDGLGFVKATERKGFSFVGKRALLIGAGGAGSAISLGLLEAGVASLSIHDTDSVRRDALIAKLEAISGNVHAGNSNPAGFDLIVNASPSGMPTYEPLPIDTARLTSDMFVGCVVTDPALTPLIDAARTAGCLTVTGVEMYRALEDIMVDFLSDGATA